MIARASRLAAISSLALFGLFPACSDDAPAPGNPTPAGAGGRAGSSAAGSGGARAGNTGAGNAGRAGAAGQGGSPGSSGSSGKAGAAGATSGNSGNGGAAGTGSSGKAGASGTHASSGAAGTPSGNGGKGGTAPGTSGASGTSGSPPDGPTEENPTQVIPTTCAFANHNFGCCGPDGNAYRYEYYTGVQKETCGKSDPCGWDPFLQYYRCGGPMDEEPNSQVRRICGAPVMTGTHCPEGDCKKADDFCDPAIWGAGAHCNPKLGFCVQCDTDAECSNNRYCDPISGHCRERLCETDAFCKLIDPTKPACSPEYHTCVECWKDENCSGVGKNGCFINTCGCKDDSACVASPLGRRCDDIELTCGCATAKDCPASAPLCIGYVCASCAEDADCKSAAGKPYCVPGPDTRHCLQCRKDTDCDVGKPFCSAGVCQAGCQTAFDCKGSTPTCVFSQDGIGSCVPAPTCATDDGHEMLDDSPLTTTTVLSTGQSVAGQVCGLPGETDFFSLGVANAEDVVLKLQSDDKTVFVSLVDAKGILMGMSAHSKPQLLHVRALPAGTYYAAVGLGAEEGSAVTSAYTLERLSGSTPCTSDESCGATTGTELFRGRCDAVIGACRFIEGNHALSGDAPCDDDDDCASGFCAGYAFAKNPGKRSRCSAPCDAQTPLGVQPKSSLCSYADLDAYVCTTFEEVNRCILPCTSDEECPLLDLLAEPPAGQPWRHLTCSAKGHCELPP